jgi:S-adenosylhomocysteine hydrolase
LNGLILMTIDLPICEQLLRAHASDFCRQEHLIVQHLKFDTATIAQRLRDLGGKIRSVIAIDYSCDPAALSELEQAGIPVSFVRFTEIGEFVSNAGSDYEHDNLAVWDVGGYAADTIANRALARKIRFAVEDTNSGLWRYQSKDELYCPVIEVASIEHKQVENAHVGKRIVETSETFFRTNGVAMPTTDVAVIGFGGIGRNVCASLRRRGINPTVVEIDRRKLALAHAADHPVATSIGEVVDARLIFGCTGKASVKFDELRKLRNQAFLISGSSKQIEFSDVFSKAHVIKVDTFVNAVLEPTSKAVVVNNGEPINLHYGSLSPEISDFMYAAILAAVIEGDTVRRAAIHQLSDRWQQEIAELWYEHYGTQPAGGQLVSGLSTTRPTIRPLRRSSSEA